MSTDPVPVLQWSSQLTVAPPSRTPLLPGDKIVLPQSALEQLLSAAAVTVEAPARSQSYTTTFDPYNPYSYAAERHARAQFADRQQQLPHPLTFRLVNPSNGRIVYAGIREFSAEDSEIGLSPFLRESLGLGDGGIVQDSRDADSVEETTEGAAAHPKVDEAQPKITVHAKEVPKGTYVRLRPLEAGYDPEDWKALLERHLRDNFTTLTHGEILSVPGGRDQQFRFLVDKLVPSGDGICIVDTDLEVDIEPLNEEQARETLKKRLAKSQRAPGTREGSSTGGTLELGKEEQGQVLGGEFVDYDLSTWDRSRGVLIEVDSLDDHKEVDLFVSPLAPRQRSRPRDDEYVFGDLSGRPAKRLRLKPTNVEVEQAEALWISVHAYKSSDEEEASNGTSSKKAPVPYHVRVRSIDSSSVDDNEPSPAQNDEPPGPDEVRCKNCRQWVPQRTLFLHENFCLRNNILCPTCKNVFIKTSPEWKNHWHCPYDPSHGNTSSSHQKHDHIFHTPCPCPNCPYHAPDLPSLAHHRTTLCPAKLILCQFCHLLVPQQSPTDPSPHDPEVLLSGLTPHELTDGARTTECHLCAKIVRLRDMKTHLKHHDLERRSRPRPRICRNVNCGRTLDGVGRNGDVGAAKRMDQGPGNELGLCSICFGPLYVSMYDPDGRALKRRVERRYLTQLLAGCGRAWCSNAFCKTGRKNVGLAMEDGEEVVTAKDALPMAKPFVDGLANLENPLHFCVDEGSQKRRVLAEMLAAEGSDDHDRRDGSDRSNIANGIAKGKGEVKTNGTDAAVGYDLEWCVAALEAEGGDLERARGWLKNWANSRAEVRGR
ncbi:hypothetical protein MMC16_006580 [Acarospora aff. strigata]|nr:hypothetical protein [Acarospora aff. strigata]